MAIVLAIKDSEGTLVYDLLQNALSNLHVDYPSIVLSPLEDGRYEISYRMFSNSKDTIATMDDISDIDELTYRVNRYGNNPITAPQLWLHEKSEPEGAERRAILTMASFQPTWEGSVGALMVNDTGWVGLLRLTRGDWEETEAIGDSETMHPVPPNYPVVDYWARVIPGSLEARVERLALTVGEVSTLWEISAGYRAENKDVSNYQPVANMGAGLFDVDGNAIGAGSPTSSYEMIPYGTNNFTSPAEQPNPPYVGYWHNLDISDSYTHYIYLSEISLSDLNSFNDDYMAEYEIFARIAFDNATPDVYHKIQLGHGDVRQNLIQNDPVYLTGTERPPDTGTQSDWYQISLGKISLPQSEFVTQAGDFTEYLKNFTLALTTEIIGVADAGARLVVDSLMLMPANTVTVNSVGIGEAPGTVVAASLIMGQTPTGIGGFIMGTPYTTMEVTGSVSAQPRFATLVVIANVKVDLLTGYITVGTDIIPKHRNINND